MHVPSHLLRKEYSLPFVRSFWLDRMGYWNEIKLSFYINIKGGVRYNLHQLRLCDAHKSFESAPSFVDSTVLLRPIAVDDSQKFCTAIELSMYLNHVFENSYPPTWSTLIRHPDNWTTWSMLPKMGNPGGPGIALMSRTKREFLQHNHTINKADVNTNQVGQLNPIHSNMFDIVAAWHSTESLHRNRRGENHGAVAWQRYVRRRTVRLDSGNIPPPNEQKSRTAPRITHL